MFHTCISNLWSYILEKLHIFALIIVFEGKNLLLNTASPFSILPCIMHTFCPNFWGKNKDVRYTLVLWLHTMDIIMGIIIPCIMCAKTRVCIIHGKIRYFVQNNFLEIYSIKHKLGKIKIIFSENKKKYIWCSYGFSYWGIYLSYEFQKPVRFTLF